MNESLWILTLTAGSIGVVHTVIGPDHYIPFIMMARARGWNRTRTMGVTFLCGIGHVLSSIILGAVGIAFGVALKKLELIESVRGELAAWALITFGIVYMIWGLQAAWKRHPHEHEHVHENGTEHSHQHTHLFGHSHGHVRDGKSMTTWTLFAIFVLGPCEPLIPILMYPAATESLTGMVLVTSVFAIATIASMMVMVLTVSAGIERIPARAIERWTHALAGGMIAVSGLAIQFLGL